MLNYLFVVNTQHISNYTLLRLVQVFVEFQSNWYHDVFCGCPRKIDNFTKSVVMQRPERHGTPRNVVWLDTSNLDIVLRRRRTPRHFSGRCVSESVERLCPSQWFLRSKGGLYQCPRSWIGSVKLEKNFVSVKKQGFFSESMVSEVCAVGQRNIRFIRMFMSVAEVKETFG